MAPQPGLVLRSPEDYINAALGRIGYRLRIGSIYDGSDAASAALDLYSQTRDMLLRDQDYGFAERDVTLTLLKTAPNGGYMPPRVWTPATDPILPWIYEYAYPTASDILKVRSLRGAPIFIPEVDPRPVNFRIANDNSLSPPARVILCNLANAVLVYTGQVTDPTTWEASFGEVMIAALARRLAPQLASLDVAKIEAADEQIATATATQRIG